ncbi:miraculin-like [Lycium ferocissimum]|uniref:miraculin-like n=1 Tax=Lycium ferocissimum TaxID=112874 RepID=UPI002815C192|nr:miraculin-like [Lycium ferocissimum]
MKAALLLLLLSVITTFANSAPSLEPEPVLDINGKILRTHTTYFVVPVKHGKYEGISLESTGNEKCQLGVVQQLYGGHGSPVALFPVNPKKGVIRVSTDLNIAMFSTHECDQSTVWQLENYDSKTGKYFIKDGGVEGNPGPQTIRNWFKIEKHGRSYKFVYCPSVCSYCKVICKDVGVYMVNGQRRLALSDVPLVFNFRKEVTP